MITLHAPRAARWTPWLLLACSTAPREAPPSRVAAPASPPAHAPDSPPSVTAPAPPARTAEPLVLITERAVLAALEAAGLGLGALVGAGPQADASNAALSALPAFAPVVSALAADMAEIEAKDPQAGVGIRGNAHRLFDLRWLSSAAHRFELIGVVNRLDRRPFHARACGETRLVYRLAYVRDGQASRLPMTAIVELAQPEADGAGSCRAAAARWVPPAGASGAALASWLRSEHGPLAAALVTRERIAQLALNLQSVRWPSAVRPALGGHAEYVLRAFRWDAARERFTPRPLENTPDVARLRREPALREALREWLASPETLDAIEGGTALMPERFLALRAGSVTPRGLARRANRPFRRVLPPGELSALAPALSARGSSPEALLRRLDGLSCTGCHQSRAVAGFHLLGEDGEDTAAGNALALPASPHLIAEQPRRAAYLRAVLRGGVPDERRPPAERAGDDDDGYGAACGLGDPGFASWRCGAGLRCDASAAASGEDSVGVCLPETPDVGDPCELSRVLPSDDPHRDGVSAKQARACAPGAVCERTAVGFPSGMCAASCRDLSAHGACGAIAILDAFNACLARKEPFARCLAEHTRPGGLRACSAAEPCRDDYICSRLPGGGGACIPPYFLFQLRVDGHP